MRLIDADALEKENICDHCTNKGARCEYMCNDNGYGEDAIWQMIDDAQTIDAVEVVRCKDCLHYRPMVVFDGKCICDVFDWKAEPEDYCSFAERKEVRNDGTD